MTIPEHAELILKEISTNKNILLLGPPATGKSLLMAEAAKQFRGTQSAVAAIHVGAAAPLPAVAGNNIPGWMPSATRSDRKIFHITFHQGTKHRDFVSGIIPKLQEGQTGFQVIHGLLVEANAHAMNGGTSLVMIDEMNRGPAVSIFGDTLTAIEADKRLDDNNEQVYTSAPFKVFDAEEGVMKDMYLSPHVYLLASMNEADTSVEALDIAFLRRFKSERLYPSEQTIKDAFGIVQYPELPVEATGTEHIVTALIEAWKQINARISLGKGSAFQIGHGVIIGKQRPQDIGQARKWAVDCWKSIDALVKELFYGNDESLAVIFNAKTTNSYKLKEFQFGEETIEKLIEPEVNEDNIYSLLREIVN